MVVIGDLVTDVRAHLAEPLAFGSDAAAAVRTGGGGSGANVAAWLAHVGEQVVFVGRVGDDSEGRLRVEELRAAGVRTCVGVDEHHPTGTVIVIVTPDGERTMIPDRGANLRLRTADVPSEVFVAGAHLHLSGYTLFEEGPRRVALAALERARAAGMTISVDPSSVQPLLAAGTREFLSWTEDLDLCMPNADEARALTRIGDVDGAAVQLATRYAEVVVTLGAEGALWTDGVEVLRVQAAPASVVDTTGAGDAFTAGYLAAWREGRSAADRLERGAELAAAAIGVAGARPC